MSLKEKMENAKHVTLEEYNKYNEGYDDGYKQGQADIPKCRDCNHWKVLNLTQAHLCEVFNRMTKASDYCSFAERKESKNV